MRIQRQRDTFAYRLAVYPLDYSNGQPPVAGPQKYTDEDWQRHVAFVESELNKRLQPVSKGGGVPDGDPVHDSYWEHSTTDPVSKRRVLSPERQALHQKIMDHFLAKIRAAPRQRKAIMLGGLGGAGKGSILEDERSGVAMVKDPETGRLVPRDYAVINPDDIKEFMARNGGIPEIEGLSPMEASPLVHEEASDIAKDLAKEAYELGTNVIWDYTMGSEGSTIQRIKDMQNKDYKDISGIFVDVDPETAKRRSQKRWRGGQGAAPKPGEPYVGGRSLLSWVYPEWAPRDPQSGKMSVNAEVFHKIANTPGMFTGGYISYDNRDDPNYQNPDGSSIPRIQDAGGKWTPYAPGAPKPMQTVASRRIMAEMMHGVDPASIRGILRAYRAQQIGYPELVEAIVSRYLEIGPQERHRSGAYFIDAEDIPDDDSGYYIESAVRRGLLTPEEDQFLMAEIGRAFAQQA